MRSNPDVSLRVAIQSDLLCLSTLATQVFLDTYATNGINALQAREVEVNLSVSALSFLLERAGTTFILAEREGNLVGFVQLTHGSNHMLVTTSPAIEIDRLYVQEPFTGRGIGTLLLRQSEAIGISAGAHTLWLKTWVGNHRALRFYAAQGYQDLGGTIYTFESESFENRLFAKALPNVRQEVY
jgi:diamine N-acetyltransferase